MRRYRINIANVDFDSRVLMLEPPQDSWEPQVKELQTRNRERVLAQLKADFGSVAYDQKVRNFTDLGIKSMSVIAFHNAFFEQARRAFVVGAYYPALTGACALGERILNHLLLRLREHYRARPEYKSVYRKDSFDNWDVPIDTLESWGILLPKAAADFRLLKGMRNNALHFNPETDANPRQDSLDAILCLQRILGEQFAGFGAQPWFIVDVPGEGYLKKAWEMHPFVRLVYLPNAVLVSPQHRIKEIIPNLVIEDLAEGLSGEDISDEEFSRRRHAFLATPAALQ